MLVVLVLVVPAEKAWRMRRYIAPSRVLFFYPFRIRFLDVTFKHVLCLILN